MTHQPLHALNTPLSQIGPYSFTAGSSAVASGRLSYTFGLQGPSASVDTACSSSLVATHLAWASLVAGECGQAMAAGVQLNIVPQSTAMVAAAGLLAPDGRSKVRLSHVLCHALEPEPNTQYPSVEVQPKSRMHRLKPCRVLITLSLTPLAMQFPACDPHSLITPSGPGCSR